jgi:hypothetical protein
MCSSTTTINFLDLTFYYLLFTDPLHQSADENIRELNRQLQDLLVQRLRYISTKSFLCSNFRSKQKDIICFFHQYGLLGSVRDCWMEDFVA